MVANLIKSRPGRAIRAIRDNETSAAVSGVSLRSHKTLSFGVASALGGVGGIVYVAELGIASPGDFTQLLAILFIVGTRRRWCGHVARRGRSAVSPSPSSLSGRRRRTNVPGIPDRWLQGPTGTLILGVLLIVFTFFLPGGVVAGFRQFKAKVVRIVPATPNGFQRSVLG